jgi:hypothetical protein
MIFLVVAVPCSIGLWNGVTTQRRIDAALHASNTQATLDHSLKGVTGLRVWGAGARGNGDAFCSCAIVPRPERVYYETVDLAEIQGFIAIIRPRPYLTLVPPAASCGQVTIDFLRGEQRLLSIHLKGPDLSSTKGVLPITSGSYAEIEEWLKQRSVRERILAAWNLPAKK